MILWAPSLALGCAGLAARVGAVSLLAGGTMGLMLAFVTRTRRPLHIYLYLLCAVATLWPIFNAWPPASADDVHPWRGAPELVSGYFDILRLTLFFVGIPFPFARWGYHAADPLPEAPPPERDTIPDPQNGENNRNRNAP